MTEAKPDTHEDTPGPEEGERCLAMAIENVVTRDGRMLEGGGIWVIDDVVPLESDVRGLLCRRHGYRRVHKKGSRWFVHVEPGDVAPDEWVTPVVAWNAARAELTDKDEEVTVVTEGEIVSVQVVKRADLAWPPELLGVGL